MEGLGAGGQFTVVDDAATLIEDVRRESKNKDVDRVKPQWRVLTLASIAAPGKLDLRNREHAKKLEAVLTAVDLD